MTALEFLADLIRPGRTLHREGARPAVVHSILRKLEEGETAERVAIIHGYCTPCGSTGEVRVHDPGCRGGPWECPCGDTEVCRHCEPPDEKRDRAGDLLAEETA